MTIMSQHAGSASTDSLQSLHIHRGLETSFIGRTIYLFREMDSTNRAALDLIRSRPTQPNVLKEGDLILAESQHRGKGRLGRRWISPPGVNLYASFVLRPQIEATQAPLITCLAATAAVYAIRQQTGLAPAIKWPNDILIRGKKTAGILTELGLRGSRVDYLILGMGMNVNLEMKDLPEEVRIQATSLRHELGQAVNRNALMAALCNKLEAGYLRFSNEGPDTVLREFRALTETLGKRVRVSLPHRTLVGWAEDLDRDGALILRLEGRRQEVIRSGDVTHLRDEAS